MPATNETTADVIAGDLDSIDEFVKRVRERLRTKPPPSEKFLAAAVPELARVRMKLRQLKNLLQA